MCDDQELGLGDDFATGIGFPVEEELLETDERGHQQQQRDRGI